MSRELTLRSIIERQDRACVDVDTSVFYPRQRIRGAIGYAKQICALCPIAIECRDYALAHDLDGVWGGTTQDERRAESNSGPNRGNDSASE